MPRSGSSLSILAYACTGALGTAADPKDFVGTCLDVKPTDVDSAHPNVALCAKNMVYAKETGLSAKPNDYKNYADLTANSGWGEFQCMLWHKNQNHPEIDGCRSINPCTPQPLKLNLGENRKICEGVHKDCDWLQWTQWSTCTATKSNGTTRSRTRTTNTNCNGDKKPATDEWNGKTTDKDDKCKIPIAAPAPKPSQGWPWYAWALVVAGALCILGGLVYAFYPNKAPKKKKKRAVKKPADPAPPPTMTPAPVVTTSVPMPAYTYAAPVTYAAPPTTVYAAPQVTYAAPASISYAPASMSYAAPQATVASAVQYNREPVTNVANAAFNMIDTNHDGVISRQEMAAAMQ